MNTARHTIPELNRKGLREFGCIFGGMIALLFGLLLPWLFERPIPRWPWLVLAAMVAWSVAAPTTLRPLYKAWMTFGLFMSRITTPLIMGVIFYAVITPTGLIRRMFAGDTMQRQWDSEAESYRSESERLPDERLNKPF